MQTSEAKRFLTARSSGQGCLERSDNGSRPEHAEAGADTPALANHIVDRVLEQANDWRLWDSGSELTAFAEAAPEVVLDRIEICNFEPPPFVELFRQEGDGFLGGGCHHAGLLWALEYLA